MGNVDNWYIVRVYGHWCLYIRVHYFLCTAYSWFGICHFRKIFVCTSGTWAIEESEYSNPERGLPLCIHKFSHMNEYHVAPQRNICTVGICSYITIACQTLRAVRDLDPKSPVCVLINEHADPDLKCLIYWVWRLLHFLWLYWQWPVHLIAGCIAN